MRLPRVLVVAVTLGALGLGCARDTKTSVPPPSPNDKPMGSPKNIGGGRRKSSGGQVIRTVPSPVRVS